ncbi:hypothetical protein F4779DRAFT_305655 [Xylariaceae sp. FL0662B]|nr:hypothetical protein F4779DRAFT_305655 [Xylariaceae sp. FL0662B]
MSPIIYSCVLCGYIIGDNEGPDPSWADLFRIFYSIEEQIAVTGVGFYNDAIAGRWVAPLDFGARWDTAESSVQIGVFRQMPVNGRHGFPFHEACWSLLEKAYSPRPIPQRRLFEVCHSLPYSTRLDCLTWDHDFGGLISADNDHYPWEDLFVDQELAFARNNPYHVPEIQQLPYEAPTSPDISEVVAKSADIFTKVPPEIIASISLHLSTTDYLNARLALPSFHPVFYNQQFWASRFLPNADRSWVFESQNWEKSCDWRWLYRRTANGSPGMKNRERVWRLIEKAKEILCLQWTEPISDYTADAANINWLEATGDLQPNTQLPYKKFIGGCLQFHERHVCIPPDQLSHVAFSLIQLGDTTYITGVRLILIRGGAIQLGYIADVERILNITCLTGLKLAVGSRGIQAIQCILDDDQELPWVGYPDKAPRTTRLRFAGPITDIKAGFDGYKMVSLAAAGCSRPGHDNLRDLAFWYPRIPETGLYLNEGSFTARQNAMTRYEPISWTMFGGPAGIYLRQLTGISVTDYGDCPKAIEFHYDSENVPLECRKVGRCTPSDYAEVMHFEIDGSGGEVIDSLIVYLEYPTNAPWFYKSGVLLSFKVSTNWGRSYHFTSIPRGEIHRIAPVEKTITLVEGSTINGFYWTQHENNITALGAISEML